MAKDDLEGMNVKALRELLHRIDGHIVNRMKSEKQDLKAKMEALAAEAGLSLDDVLGGGRAKGSRAPVAAKYRNPENPSETWSGRGRRPIWMAEKLAKRGVTIDDFKI